MSKSKATATKSKNRKMMKNLNEDRRLMKNMGAFEDLSLSDAEIRDTIAGSGLEDIYTGTTGYDNEW